MLDKRLSFAIFLTSFILLGSEAMAQEGDQVREYRAMKEKLKSMTPEQRRAWWQSLPPEKREKMKERRSTRGNSQGRGHLEGGVRGGHGHQGDGMRGGRGHQRDGMRGGRDHPRGDNDHSGRHDERLKKHPNGNPDHRNGR